MGFAALPEYVAPDGAWNACRLGDYKDFAPDGTATGTLITCCYSMFYTIIKRHSGLTPPQFARYSVVVKQLQK